MWITYPITPLAANFIVVFDPPPTDSGINCIASNPTDRLVLEGGWGGKPWHEVPEELWCG